MDVGDIFMVQFSPSVGHEYQKIRPAIVVSKKDVIERFGIVTCIAITSKLRAFVPTYDIRIDRSKENRLLENSVIKMLYLSTLDTRRCKKYIGRVDLTTMRIIRKKIAYQLCE